MKNLSLTIFALINLVCLNRANISSYLTIADEEKVLTVLTRSLVKLQPGDVITSHYGIKGFNLLKKKIVLVLIKDNCLHLENQFKKTATAVDAYHALTSWDILKCQGALHSDTTITAMNQVIESAASTTADIRYALEALQVIKQTIPNPAKIAQLLQKRLQEDDSLVSVGHALHASSYLGDHGKFALDRIEEIIAQLDEVDGQLAQWEGGLSVSSVLITALLRLPQAQVTAHLTPAIVDKLAAYLLSRRTVQTPKGALALTEAIVALQASNYSPIIVTVQGWASQTEIKVRVCDILGGPVKGGVKGNVVAQSATRVADDVVVLSKQPFKAGATDMDFLLTLSNLDPGQYRIVLTVNQRPSTVTVRISGPVTLTAVTIGLADVDDASLAQPQPIAMTYPNQMSSVLNADHTQQLILKFSLSRPIHQMFLRMWVGKREIIFIGEKEAGKTYKIAVNLAAELGASGEYETELILGDAIMSNPIRWHLGTVNVKLPPSAAKESFQKAAKPEIIHQFRPAEKRPAQVVSMLFSGLAAFPLIILVIVWMKVGVNVRNFTVKAIPFHTGIASILGLFVCFWLKLDMFQTCAWLVPIGGFTFLAGNYALKNIANKRIGSEASSSNKKEKNVK